MLGGNKGEKTYELAIMPTRGEETFVSIFYIKIFSLHFEVCNSFQPIF